MKRVIIVLVVWVVLICSGCEPYRNFSLTTPDGLKIEWIVYGEFGVKRLKIDLTDPNKPVVEVEGTQSSTPPIHLNVTGLGSVGTGRPD